MILQHFFTLRQGQNKTIYNGIQQLCEMGNRLTAAVRGDYQAVPPVGALSTT
jgi:hypothetical protein